MVANGIHEGAYRCIRREMRFLLEARDTCALKIEVKLHEKGFCERVLAPEGLHSLKQELERRTHLLVFGASLEVLDKDARCNIDAKGYKGVHLLESALENQKGEGCEVYRRQIHVTNHPHQGGDFSSC